jgi:hypothetical protein
MAISFVLLPLISVGVAGAHPTVVAMGSHDHVEGALPAGVDHGGPLGEEPPLQVAVEGEDSGPPLAGEVEEGGVGPSMARGDHLAALQQPEGDPGRCPSLAAAPGEAGSPLAITCTFAFGSIVGWSS